MHGNRVHGSVPAVTLTFEVVGSQHGICDRHPCVVTLLHAPSSRVLKNSGMQLQLPMHLALQQQHACSWVVRIHACQLLQKNNADVGEIAESMVRMSGAEI